MGNCRIPCNNDLTLFSYALIPFDSILYALALQFDSWVMEMRLWNFERLELFFINHNMGFVINLLGPAKLADFLNKSIP